MEKQPVSIEQYYNQIAQHHDISGNQVSDSNIAGTFKDGVDKLKSTLHRTFSSQLLVITGEQPYGAMGKPKVVGKRLLAQALRQAHPDVKIVELFANHDLVGSEEGFYRLDIPTRTKPEGIITENVLSDRYRKKDQTASGIKLPHEYLGTQLAKIVSSMRAHYPRYLSGAKTPRFDMDIINQWIKSYGLIIDESTKTAHFDPIKTPDNYAEANIQWLIDLERRLGLEMDFITREGEIDLELARNGGAEVMNSLWEHGLTKISNSGYSPVTLKSDELESHRTTFNLATNGLRIPSRFSNNDGSLIEIFENGQVRTITLDEALSGQFNFSWRAIPRVLVYSLAGIDGHITGGGSVYNSDAKFFMDQLRLPYFPIINMDPRLDGEKASPLIYSTISTGSHSEASKQLVRAGGVSLLDLALSCDIDQTRQLIEQALENEFDTHSSIRLVNKEEMGEKQI